jgi:hypothetical protein
VPSAYCLLPMAYCLLRCCPVACWVVTPTAPQPQAQEYHGKLSSDGADLIHVSVLQAYSPPSIKSCNSTSPQSQLLQTGNHSLLPWGFTKYLILSSCGCAPPFLLFSIQFYCNAIVSNASLHGGERTHSLASW